MTFHIVTIFPEFFRGPLACGILGRARQSGLVTVEVHDLRTWTKDVHRSVDDRPFGGEEGMVMKIEPIDAALAEVTSRCAGDAAWKVLLSAQGRRFDQSCAQRLAAAERDLVLVCGRYEGVDERVAQHLVDEELSVGDYVLSGGEWAAGVIVDSVTRLRPGAVGNAVSTRRESFAPLDGDGVGILDHPQYTRPARYAPQRLLGESWDVPEVLLSGHHAEVARWRREAALAKTRANRPDLLRSGSPARIDTALEANRESGLAGASRDESGETESCRTR